MVYVLPTDSESNPSGERRDPEHPEYDDEPEKREDLEADFIPMPGKDIVPGKKIIYINLNIESINKGYCIRLY